MTRLRTPLLSTTLTALLLMATAVRADDYGDVDRLFGAGQFTEAVQKADQYLAGHPRDARMRFLKGLVLSEQGKTSEAIAVFSKLSEDHPELPEPYNNLAVLYGKAGQYDQARRALESAIRTNPSYATAYENLGDVYAKLASQAYAKALQIDGSNTAKVSPKLAMIRDLFTPQNTGRTATASVATTQAATTAPRATAPGTTTASAGATPTSLTPPAATTAAPVPPPISAKPVAQQPPVTTDTKGPQAAALAWAQAWSRKDMNAYFAAYTRDFNGGKSRKAWEEERRDRIMGKRSISVSLSDIEVQVKGDRAVVKFHQAYKADSLKASSRKTLSMVRVAGQWLIDKESTGS